MSGTKLVIGVDEAGYGPCMGPLTVCATVWRIPVATSVDSLCSSLEPEFSARPLSAQSSHVPIGDSKQINQGPFAKQGLERGARFLLNTLLKENELQWDDLLKQICLDDWSRIKSIAWYADTEALEIPFNSDRDNFAFQSARNKLTKSEVRLLDIGVRVLDEPEFNRQVDERVNKSNVLSETSLGLVRNLVWKHATPDEMVEIYCDKHGGRNRYQGVLSHCFDQIWFEIEMEGRHCSRYCTKWNDVPIRIQFRVGGDNLFPSAAASIVAKWTREWLMNRLNAFWAMRIPEGLKPTAGYYVDALRFAAEIEREVNKLKWPRDLWWRKK